MTVRTQYGVPSLLHASLADTAEVQLTTNRPRNLPVERNTIDHVARPYTRQEFEGGLAVVEVTSSANATLSLRAVEIMDWEGNVARTVLSTALDAYALDLTVTSDLLSRLMIAEDEAGVRLTIHNFSGGAAVTAIQVRARFDFGLHNANYGSNQGL
jgi:hypothetical protein